MTRKALNNIISLRLGTLKKCERIGGCLKEQFRNRAAACLCDDAEFTPTDYAGSLDEMHRIELTLPDERYRMFIGNLVTLLKPGEFSVRASAHKRAEAFVMTESPPFWTGEWEPMTTAPKDGTPIIGFIEGDEIEVQWSERRTCMMAGIAGGNGYFGAGWEDCENKLISDTPEKWKEVDR